MIKYSLFRYDTSSSIGCFNGDYCFCEQPSSLWQLNQIHYLKSFFTAIFVSKLKAEMTVPGVLGKYFFFNKVHTEGA